MKSIEWRHAGRIAAWNSSIIRIQLSASLTLQLFDGVHAVEPRVRRSMEVLQDLVQALNVRLARSQNFILQEENARKTWPINEKGEQSSRTHYIHIFVDCDQLM